MDTIIAKLRDLIDDNLITIGRDTFTFESSTSSKIFTLTEANVSSATIIVLKNGVVWVSSNYTYSANTGKLTVTGTLTAGDSIEVDYSYYQKYSDSELRGFIKSAIIYLATEKYGTFTVKSDNVIFPTPDESQEDLIALIASILIKGDIVQYRTPELTLMFERGDSKEKKIRKVVRQFSKTYGCLKYIDYNEKYPPEDEIV